MYTNALSALDLLHLPGDWHRIGERRFSAAELLDRSAAQLDEQLGVLGQEGEIGQLVWVLLEVVDLFHFTRDERADVLVRPMANRNPPRHAAVIEVLVSGNRVRCRAVEFAH